MALRDFTTNEAADVLVQLSPLLDNIATDDTLMKTIGKGIKKDGLTKVGIAMEGLHRVFASTPLLLQDHREDVFGIVAIINRKTVDEVKEQNIVQTISEIKALVEDKDLLSFFSTFGLQVKGA